MFVQSSPGLPTPEGMEMRPPVPRKETGRVYTCTHALATAPGASPGHNQPCFPTSLGQVLPSSVPSARPLAGSDPDCLPAAPAGGQGAGKALFPNPSLKGEEN